MAAISVNTFYSHSRQKKEQGKLSLSKAEQLLMAIANDSEVEDLSNGEENDPAVDGDIPRDAGDNYSPPSSPEYDSDEDYSPPDAEEADHYITEDESESEQQRSQVHQRKRNRVENDEQDEELGCGDSRAEPRNVARGERWKSAPFTPDLFQFQGKDDYLRDERMDWQPLDYVEQYIDSELLKLLTDCTNAMSLANSGRSLNTSVEEMYYFFGVAILMSCVHYPQTKMFWSNALRVPAISDKMSRDRFFKLRSHLKVVIDDDIPEDKKKTDKFWKVRPFMDRILKGCRLQARPECVSIDEQMIPFTGACPFRQYVLLKPNPVGMKNFVLASTDGIVLDFEVYQGAKTLALQVQESEGLGLGALVIKRLSETLQPGTKVYCDRFFTTMSAVEHMLRKQVYLTGTVMKNKSAAESEEEEEEDEEEEWHKFLFGETPVC
ncbi:uncharacterized protein LOC121643526 [Melanotaenia boesemani]|uniref:uncharacterized protein LOC121643526 n=1 Tax=Melanotaenia boesemani TaxID=1250792 RepID=UPI001C055423|nr:uncharacterized protein LOC121643526 [Melanotaenia boesemani]